MTPEIARNALVLLSRVDIKGAEAPIFMQVMQALQFIAEPSQAPIEPAGPRLVRDHVDNVS